MKSHYELPFEKLRVWQQTRKWIEQVYSVTDRFPKSEAYNLTSQLNRAAVSVATNLAEGTARTSSKDQAHFSTIAYGSLMESACLSILACDRGYISEGDLNTQREEIASIANQINSLRKSQVSNT